MPPNSAKSPIVNLPGVFSPAIQLQETFQFQSYFDSTLLENAILLQRPGQLIVQSTKLESQLQGWALGLHPSSETPIAVQFKVAGASGSSATYVLKPGQIIRPTGIRDDGKASFFAGFDWGLPFGWLGGGMATIVVFQTPDAWVDWSAHREVIFQRSRYEILQPNQLTAAGNYNNAPRNWPGRFPWTQARQGTAALAQQGEGILAVEPTRAFMVLRGTTALGAAVDMRMVMQGSNEVGLDANSDVDNTIVPPYDTISWPAYASLGTSGNLASQDPCLLYEGHLARATADDGGVVFVDASGAATLNGAFVDVVRYGRL